MQHKYQPTKEHYNMINHKILSALALFSTVLLGIIPALSLADLEVSERGGLRQTRKPILSFGEHWMRDRL